MLEPHDVAHKIIATIEREEQGELALPALVGITWLWRGLPSYVTDFLRWVRPARRNCLPYSPLTDGNSILLSFPFSSQPLMLL